jgi:CheY-like chemotaxis protein/class 3 adenylate cyclase
MKILVIEDSSASRLMMQKLLRAIVPGVEVTLATNAKNALLLIASDVKFDCIILDLGLPDIGGLQVLELFKNLSVQSPIITISDEGNQEALKQSIELGAVDYLTKPISKAQVISTLSKHISLSDTPVSSKILIVDDDKTNRTILIKMVEKAGYSWEEASNGFEAIRQTKKHHFCCILMDIRMPFMDGIEATEAIKRELPHIPIVFVTAEELPQVTEKCIKAGGFRVLGKPVKKTELLQTVKDAIESSDSFTGKETPDDQNKSPITEKMSFPIFEDFLKFVPKNFVDHSDLNKHMNRGIARKEDVSVLFIDIRKFTEMTEDMTTDQCFNFLNSYFEMIEPIIHSFGGMVYQFLGDGIVCTFPLHKGKYSGNAVHAAVSVQDHITIYNRGRVRAGYEPISVGCGISTGELAIGICGSNTRYEVGVFGSTMNIAARSQGACRDFGIDITITSNTYERLEDPDIFLIRPVGSHKLKGVKQKVPLFEVFSHNHPMLRDRKCDCVKYLKQIQKDREDLPVKEMTEKFPDDILWQRLAELREGLEIH